MSDLESNERQTVLEPVFSVLLRVRVEQYIIHLKTHATSALYNILGDNVDREADLTCDPNFIIHAVAQVLR